MSQKNKIKPCNQNGYSIPVLILFSGLFFVFGNSANAQNGTKTYGIASYYADYFHGRTTASGEVFSQDSLTAAHNTLPFGTLVKVTNLSNSKEVVLKINDRGPFVDGRIIDLSKSAAEKLDFLSQGLVKVTVEVVGQRAIFPNYNKDVKSQNLVRQKEDKPINIVNRDIDTNSIFTVQVGSFSIYSNAEKALTLLSKIDSGGFIKEATINGKKVFRVQCGKNLKGFEAEQKKKILLAAFPSAFILKFEE